MNIEQIKGILEGAKNMANVAYSLFGIEAAKYAARVIDAILKSPEMLELLAEFFGDDENAVRIRAAIDWGQIIRLLLPLILEWLNRRDVQNYRTGNL